MLRLWFLEACVMKMEAVQTMRSQNVSGVALGLLRNRGSKRWSGGDPFSVRRWIEKQLADVGGHAKEMSGIELHREIEAGIPGSAIPILLTALDITKEEFSGILGRTRKTLNELLQRERLSRADSDLLYRVSRALVHAISVFEDAGHAVQWLKDPNEALGGARPISLLATVEGDEVIHAELGAIEHGLPV
jgi:putative toxin-antitoxin system antitoxin component (TIGR02293 family)